MGFEEEEALYLKIKEQKEKIKEVVDENARLSSQLAEWQDVARRLNVDLGSERDRRTAAQEAITQHWEPEVTRLSSQLAGMRAMVTEVSEALTQWRDYVEGRTSDDRSVSARYHDVAALEPRLKELAAALSAA